MPGAALIERLKECDPVYVTLDPDAYVAEKGIKPAINRLASMLKGRARIVKLPVKPDDLFTKFDGSANDFMNFTRQAIAT
jgi:hypothetical protein